MKNGLLELDIDNAVTELISLFGIKKDIEHEELVDMIRTQHIKKGIKVIAFELGLPIEVNLFYVPKEYKKNEKNMFQSKALSETDASGRGISGITAQVSIPNNLPLYGSAELKGFNIDVKVSVGCHEHPWAFITIMAHELSHILLYSMRHPQRDSEFYTDLLPMILGFRKVVEKGRQVVEITREIGDRWETQTITYGYLSDKQFEIASNKIKTAFKERNKVKENYIKEITKLKALCSKARLNMQLFKKFLEYLGKYRKRYYKKADAHRIVLLHHIGYLDNIDIALNECMQLLAKEQKYGQITHYLNDTIETMEMHSEKIKKAFFNLSSECALVENDIRVLSRHIWFWQRAKMISSIKKGMRNKYEE